MNDDGTYTSSFILLLSLQSLGRWIHSVEKRCDPDMRTIPILVDTGHSQSVISCATHVGFVLLLLSSSSPVGEYVNTTFIVH